MAAALRRAWQRRGPLAWLLRPLSWVYGGLAALHAACYRHGWKPVARLPVPVIVVGNVVVGGAGKTPVVIALAAHLQARGLRPGVISRGYGRSTTDCREVHPDSDPAEAGDEPLLVRQRAGVPVFVARRRAEAGAALLAAHPEVQVLLADDGLQHHALGRDIEICVFDERGTGNGWLLPAGPLREPWPRPVDLVLRHGDATGIGGHVLQRRLAGRAHRADGQARPLASLRGQRLKALAGLARPEAFFSMLRERGLELAATEALPDHADFSAARPAEEAGYTLLCTEKDAAKLWRQRPDAWAVPLELAVEPAFWLALDRLLDARLAERARLSSRDGSQTA